MENLTLNPASSASNDQESVAPVSVTDKNLSSTNSKATLSEKMHDSNSNAVDCDKLSENQQYKTNDPRKNLSLTEILDSSDNSKIPEQLNTHTVSEKVFKEAEAELAESSENSEETQNKLKSLVDNEAEQSSSNIANNVVPEAADSRHLMKHPQQMSTTLTVQAFIYHVCEYYDDIRQVKVFSNDGKSETWNEKGLGVFTPKMDGTGITRFVVKSLSDPSVLLLDTCVNENTRYSMQGRTLISWISDSLSTCLSFANNYICCQTWSILQLLVPDQVYEDEDDNSEEDSSEIPAISGVEKEFTECPTDYHFEPHEEELQVHTDTEANCNEFPGFFGDYDDVRHHMFAESTGNAPNLALYQPPSTPEALADCLEAIRALERCAVSKPTETNKTLTCITELTWLQTLWNLLDESIEKDNSLTCTQIAEFLCRLIVIYAISSNPFVGLAMKPEYHRLLDPSDALVRLLSDENYEHFFKAMEYEQELRKHAVEVKHVNFLKQSSQFKEVICCSEPTFQVTAHFIYRILYLRDVCLPRHLDEITIQRLSGVVNTGYSYLCRIIQSTSGSFATLRQIIPVDVVGARFLLQLLSVLRSNAATISEKPQIFANLRNERVLQSLEGYLTEDCVAAREHRRFIRRCLRRQHEAEQQMALLIEHDVERQHRPYVLSHDRLSVQTLPEIAVEILHHVVEYNPGLLRTTILNQALKSSENPPPYWSALCRVFRTSDNEGVHTQLSDIFRRVLDPVLMESPERDDFLSIFYDRGVIDILIDVILTPPAMDFEDLLPRSNETVNPYFISSNFDLASSDDPDEDTFCDEQNGSSNFSKQDESAKDDTHKQSSNYHASMLEGKVNFFSTDSQSYNISQDQLEFDSSNHNFPSPLRRKSNEVLCPPPAKRRASNASSLHSTLSSVSGSQDISQVSPNSFIDDFSTQNCLSLLTDNEVQNKAASSSTYSKPRSLSFDAAYISAEATPLPCHKKEKLSLSQLRKRKFLESLSHTEKEELLVAARSQLSFVKCQISEILGFCVMKHNCRIKYRTLQQNLHVELIQMSFNPIFDQFLAIYAVKFLRACLTAQAEYYARVFVRHDIFTPLLFLLKHRVVPPKTRSEGSLLESVIFDFLSTIRILVSTCGAVVTLLQTLFEKHMADVITLDTYYFERCGYTLFKQLRAQYDETIQQTSDTHRRRGYWSGFLTEGDEVNLGTNPQLTPEAFGGLRYRRRSLTSSNQSSLSQRYECEYDREMQEAYFEVDDDEQTDTSLPDPQRSREVLSSNLTACDSNPILLPQYDAVDLPTVINSDVEEDDSDVPDFLKSKTNSANNNRESITKNVFNKTVKQPSFGFKLALANSQHSLT